MGRAPGEGAIVLTAASAARLERAKHLESTLDRVREQDGMLAALLVRRDGALVAGGASGIPIAGLAAAYTAAAEDLSSVLAGASPVKGLRRAQVVTGNTRLVAVPVEDDHLLILVAHAGVVADDLSRFADALAQAAGTILRAAEPS